MTKTKNRVMPTKTEGARHDVTAKQPNPVKSTQSSNPPPPPPTPTPRRTDAALKPKVPLEVLISRALDQELEWYFAYGEAALLRGDVTILPSYAAVRVLATEPDRAVQTKAIQLAIRVRMCLLSLRGPHASVLRTAYTPRSWPEPIEQAFESVAPIAVRLALASDPWPARRSRSGLEEAAASRLSAAIVAKRSNLRVHRLRARAERLLGQAVVAYAAARGLEGGALVSPEHSYDFDREAASGCGLELEPPSTPRASALDPPLPLIRRELRWFYIRMRGSVPAVVEVSAREAVAASRIAGWLSQLLPTHRGAFVVRYDGRRWPVRLVRQFGGLTSVVVRFTATQRQRGPTETLAQAEQAAVADLMADIAAAAHPLDITGRGTRAAHHTGKLRRLRCDAQTYVRRAERAYFEARAGAPCAVPSSREGA